MAIVLDTQEPWNSGEQTYNAKFFADWSGLSVEEWLVHYEQLTISRGGEVLYAGPEENRPEWLRERFAAARRARSTLSE